MNQEVERLTLRLKDVERYVGQLQEALTLRDQIIKDCYARIEKLEDRLNQALILCAIREKGIPQ